MPEAPGLPEWIIALGSAILGGLVTMLVTWRNNAAAYKRMKAQLESEQQRHRDALEAEREASRISRVFERGADAVARFVALFDAAVEEADTVVDELQSGAPPVEEWQRVQAFREASREARSAALALGLYLAPQVVTRAGEAVDALWAWVSAHRLYSKSTDARAGAPPSRPELGQRLQREVVHLAAVSFGVSDLPRDNTRSVFDGPPFIA